MNDSLDSDGSLYFSFALLGGISFIYGFQNSHINYAVAALLFGVLLANAFPKRFSKPHIQPYQQKDRVVKSHINLRNEHHPLDFHTKRPWQSPVLLPPTKMKVVLFL